MQGSIWRTILLGYLIALLINSIDLLTTLYAVNSGVGYEMNPFVRPYLDDPALLMVLHALALLVAYLGMGALILFVQPLKARPRLAKLFVIVSCSFLAYAPINNLLLIFCGVSLPVPPPIYQIWNCLAR